MKISSTVVGEFFCWEPKTCLLIFSFFFMMGCQTPPHKNRPNTQETISALAAMTQGLTNQPITEEEFKHLAIQVAHDPQAQSAIRSINTALSPQHTVKYCPEDGERFSADMIWCPDHKVKLESVE